MFEDFRKFIVMLNYLEKIPAMKEQLDVVLNNTSTLGAKVDRLASGERIEAALAAISQLGDTIGEIKLSPLATGNDATQQWWLDQRAQGKLIQLEYPVLPRLRRPAHEPITPELEQLVLAEHGSIKGLLTSFKRFKSDLERIPLQPAKPGQPSWINPWIPALDGISLYSFVASKNPKVYMEIGSGVSTTFVRQAITDHNLRTKIISIDPFPRAEIDNICDEVIRVTLEECDLAVFDRLSDGDILFCDNSHRGFQNTDVTVFFTEIVPSIVNKNILIGVHDIFLPFDYPEDWLGRHYNEQYFMIGFFLGKVWRTILPAFYCTVKSDLRAEVATIADIPMLSDANHRPAIYWFAQNPKLDQT